MCMCVRSVLCSQDFFGLSLGLGCCCVRSHTTAQLAANFLPRIPFFQADRVKLSDFKLSWMIRTRMPAEKTKSDLVFAQAWPLTLFVDSLLCILSSF